MAFLFSAAVKGFWMWANQRRRGRQRRREGEREGAGERETESRCHKCFHSTSSSGQTSLWNYPPSAAVALPSLGYENPGRRDGSYLPSPEYGRYMPFWELAYSRHIAAFSAYWTGFSRITVVLWRCFENTQLFVTVAALVCSVCLVTTVLVFLGASAVCSLSPVTKQWQPGSRRPLAILWTPSLRLFSIAMIKKKKTDKEQKW